MSRIALIIGRFQPIHLGHIELINRYSRAGFIIKIAIGSSQKSFEKHNPLTSQEREEKIRVAMKEFKINNFKIYHVPDISSKQNYVKHVLAIVGRFDTLLTGNSEVLKLFLKYKSKHPWNIESFEETSGRPGGKITSGIIRTRWIKRADKRGLPKSAFNYLKSINFTERLKEIHKRD